MSLTPLMSGHSLAVAVCPVQKSRGKPRNCSQCLNHISALFRPRCQSELAHARRNSLPCPPPNSAERLRAGLFVMTAEVAPPVSCDPQDLLRKATPLRGLADAVNITDGAGARAHRAALAASALLIDAGIEPILQIT